MSRLVDKAVDIICQAIREHVQPTTVVIIPVENVTRNVELFNQALQTHRVREAMQRSHVTVELDLKLPPVEQAKNAIIAYASQQNNAHILFPYYRRDAAEARQALHLPEVQELLRSRNLTAEIQVVDGEMPQIVVASYESFIDGTFDEFERKYKS